MNTRILAGGIAAVVGLAVVPVTFLGSVAVLARIGFDFKSFPEVLVIFFLLVVSCLVGFEAFRALFNGICERFSDEVAPAHISRVPWRCWLGFGRDDVRSS